MPAEPCGLLSWACPKHKPREQSTPKWEQPSWAPTSATWKETQDFPEKLVPAIKPTQNPSVGPCLLRHRTGPLQEGLVSRGCREAPRHCSRVGKRSQRCGKAVVGSGGVPGPVMRLGLWGSQTPGHSGTAGSLGRAETGVGGPRLGTATSWRPGERRTLTFPRLGSCP